MKKTIISLLALIACMSVNAQNLKIYKGTALVAEYTADQADNVVFSKKSGDSEQPAAKKYVLDKCITDNGDDNLTTAYYTINEKGSIIATIEIGTLAGNPSNGLDLYTYGDQMIRREAYDRSYTVFTLNDQNLITKTMNYKADGTEMGCSTFEYDSQGRLISIIDDGGISTTALTWNDDGDLVKLVESNTNGNIITTEIIPSEQSAEYGNIIKDFFAASDKILFMNGYYGKQSKHLPAHIGISTQSNSPASLTISNDYKYTISNGYITGFELKYITEMPSYHIKKESTKIYKLFWKEVQ